MKSNTLKGFQRIKPLDINSEPSTGKQIAECLLKPDNRKIYLADKLISKKRLTITEKGDIYRYLTGMEPPYVKYNGRPSTMGRDIAMAIDFLILRKSIKDTDKLMGIIRKYDKNYDIKSKVPIKNNALYSAINRGVSAIIERGRLPINIGDSATNKIGEIRFDTDYENGYLCDLPENDDDLKRKANDFRELYSLIEEYIREKEPRRKLKI